MNSSYGMYNETSQRACTHGHEIYIEELVIKAYPSYIASIVINLMSCVPTVVINFLVIVAIYRNPAIQTASNILLCSLAFTDLAVGLLVQPIYVLSRFAEVLKAFRLFCPTWLISRILASWTANASLLTLTLIAIDRVLAMHLGIRYRTLIKSSRITAVAAALWVIAGFLACVRLLTYEVRIFLGISAAMYTLCLLVLCFSYWKTFTALRNHRHKVGDTLHRHKVGDTLHRHKVGDTLQMQSRSSENLNMKCYRKSFYTMLYVVGLVLLCYLPYICLALPVVFTGRNEAERAAWTIVDTLLFLNSLLNPILYCWRMRDVRRSLLAVLRKYFPLCEPLHLLTTGLCFDRNVMETETRDTKQKGSWRTARNTLDIKSRNTCELKSDNARHL